VTAAPGGWCDFMARAWPVPAVIGENGGFYFALDRKTNTLRREFWLPPDERARAMARLRDTAERIRVAVPEVAPSSDQPFRLTTWAIEPLGAGARRAATADRVAAAWRDAGLQSTINSLWVLGWLGNFDKLAMARRLARELLGTDLAHDREAVIYVGDSLNDEPMFRFFPNSVGVSTVRDYLDRLAALPRWITKGPGGAGFVELTEMLLADR
jgi:hypothetical protein